MIVSISDRESKYFSARIPTSDFSLPSAFSVFPQIDSAAVLLGAESHGATSLSRVFVASSLIWRYVVYLPPWIRRILSFVFQILCSRVASVALDPESAARGRREE